MLYSKLAIAVTDRCNAECAICCLRCSPKGTQTLETEEMMQAIGQAAQTEGMEEICFTGGEPLLYEERVEACARYASERGLRSSVYTNGFWGSDPQCAQAWAEALYAAGVRKMHFSSDAWHQKYVSFSALETAMRCSREAGMRNELAIMESVGTNHNRQAFLSMPIEYREAKVRVHPMLPVGRAREAVPEGQVLKLFSPDRMRCCHEGTALLTPDGYYSMCCSFCVLSIPRLRIGHMREIAFSELEERVLSDDAFYIMLQDGFGWYMHALRERGFDVPEKVCFPCACCEMVFCNPSFMEQIQDEVKKHADALRRLGSVL